MVELLLEKDLYRVPAGRAYFVLGGGSPGTFSQLSVALAVATFGCFGHLLVGRCPLGLGVGGTPRSGLNTKGKTLHSTSVSPTTCK